MPCVRDNLLLSNQNHFDLVENEDFLEKKIGLYIITPTYPRPEQLPDLTRLAQTLMVLKFHFYTLILKNKKAHELFFWSM